MATGLNSSNRFYKVKRNFVAVSVQGYRPNGDNVLSNKIEFYDWLQREFATIDAFRIAHLWI